LNYTIWATNSSWKINNPKENELFYMLEAFWSGCHLPTIKKQVLEITLTSKMNVSEENKPQRQSRETST
jgi:hypothetical protein